MADHVGNTSAAGPIGGVKVDKKAPTVASGTADELLTLGVKKIIFHGDLEVHALVGRGIFEEKIELA